MVWHEVFYGIENFQEQVNCYQPKLQAQAGNLTRTDYSGYNKKNKYNKRFIIH